MLGRVGGFPDPLPPARSPRVTPTPRGCRHEGPDLEVADVGGRGPAGGGAVGRGGGGGRADPKALEGAYQPEIRGLVKRYCEQCHSEKRIEADLDLSEFATMADVRKHPQAWQKVGEMLESGQMPPRKAKQPTDAERARLRGWVRDYLTVEARAHAGDPGRVVLRRLSNAEYTHTLRDLTGVESLDPAREFPADGAAGEGFTNTGNALVMSPSLVTKYLDAAKEVAEHAVLLPDGLHFSPGTTSRDWTEERLASIREFYRRFTAEGGGGKVNLQGIVFDTNQGGRLPVERLPRRHDRRARGSDQGDEEPRGRGRRARAEREISRHALEGAQRPRAVAPAGRPPRPLAHRDPRRRGGAGEWGGGLAEGALEVRHGRPHRQGQRPESLAGARHPDRRAAGRALQDPHARGRGRRGRLARRRRRGRRRRARLRRLAEAPDRRARQARHAPARPPRDRPRPDRQARARLRRHGQMPRRRRRGEGGQGQVRPRRPRREAWGRGRCAAPPGSTSSASAPAATWP